MSDEKPWEDFADPVTGQPAAAPPGVGVGEDIAKSAAGGLGRGTAGLVGLPGDLAEYGARGIDWASRKVGGLIGVDVPTREDRAPTYGSADATKALESYTGPLYQPKTVPGQYASTIAEFAPSALLPGGGGIGARVFNTVAGALGSETAGQLTKGTAAEPWARLVGGVAAAPLAGKIVTPAAAAPAARQAAVATLEGEGIPLTAGQRTGSKTIQWAEANAADMPGSAGRAAELNANTANAYDRAVTQRLYDRGELTARGVPPDVNLPDPRVAQAGPQSLSDTYNRINQADFVSNPQLHNRMTAAQNEYERLVLPHNRTPAIEDTRNAIVDRLVAGQGRMAGDEYQSIRSQIGDAERAATNSAERRALTELKASMDEAMAAGLSPADAQALALNNRRFANMKQLDPAVAAAGENLSPQRVAQTVRSGRAANYSAQRGDLDELAKAAGQVIKPLPNSGTAARLGMQQLFHVLPPILSAGGGATAGGLLGGPIGAAIGAAAPFLASRAVVSRPGQAYLANQLLPQNARAAATQALMQQAISQPEGIARNQAERADYERKRKDDLRKMGFE